MVMLPPYKKEELMMNLVFFNIPKEFYQAELAKILKTNQCGKPFQDLWKELIQNKIFIETGKCSGVIIYYKMDKKILRKYIEQNSHIFKRVYQFMSQRKFLGMEEFYYPLD